MLLIAAFAIYVIVRKRVRITRSTTITGDNARTFGVLLLVLPIPFSLIVGALLRVLLPTAARTWPVPQTLYGILFGVVALWMAYSLRDRPTDGPLSLPASENLQSSVEARVDEVADESDPSGDAVR